MIAITYFWCGFALTVVLTVSAIYAVVRSQREASKAQSQKMADLIDKFNAGFKQAECGVAAVKCEIFSASESLDARINAISALHDDLVRQVGIMHRDYAIHIDSVAVGMRVSTDKKFSDFRELIDATSENYGLKLEGISERLVSLETENKELVTKKPDKEEDPFIGSRSWAAQAAAAERGLGVESVA